MPQRPPGVPPGDQIEENEPRRGAPYQGGREYLFELFGPFLPLSRAAGALEDRGEQPAVSAPDIDHQAHPGEVIRRGDEARLGGRVAAHGRVEHARHLGVSGEVVERAAVLAWPLTRPARRV